MEGGRRKRLRLSMSRSAGQSVRRLRIFPRAGGKRPWSRAAPVAVCLLFAAMAGCDRAGESLAPAATTAPRPERVVKVIARPVELRSNDRVFEAIGTGRARLSVEIMPKAAGEVVEIAFTAGEMVTQGQELVRLDDAEERLALRLAKVELADAKNLLARYEQAVTDGAVPQSEVDAARADVEAARVALDSARLALEDRRVRAPFSGRVGLPAVDPGERVDPSSVICSLDDRSLLDIEFEIPEALAGRLVGGEAPQPEVLVTTPAYPEREFIGTISAAEARVDKERRTLLVRARIDNDDDLLRPGMSFDTRWKIPGGEFPSVPELALKWSADGAYVWVIRDDRAVRVPVRVIARRHARVLVEGALEVGEAVVVEGVQRLGDGVAVRDLSGEAQ